jgi:hypothetical protein
MLATLPRIAQERKETEGHVADLADESAIKLLLDRLGPIDHLVFTAADPLQLGPLTATDIAAARTFSASCRRHLATTAM